MLNRRKIMEKRETMGMVYAGKTSKQWGD